MRIDGAVYYVLKDRLGSAYATTDASGNVVGEMRYYAFGETRLSTGNMFTDRLYTGQRWIAELGIYHYNARFYSPKLGRFLSADTLMSGMANPQNLNRFSYVANNPVRYTDPTGRCWIELSSHMVWFSDSDPKCGGSYTPTNDGGGEITPNDKPEGLDPDGTDAYNGLMTLNSMSGWWNADGSFYVEEALAMLLWREAGVTVGYSYDREGNQVFSYPQPVMTAITAKWQQNCSGGWNTASCLNDFWGYYQAITDISTDPNLQQNYLDYNLEDTVAIYGGDVHTREAGNIITAPTISVTSTTPIGWATVGTQSTVGQALGGNVSYQYTYPSGDAVFFVVSSQQQDAICKKVEQGPGCNLSNLAP